MVTDLVDEINVRAELQNIVIHGPLFTGETLSHATAKECEARGWAERDTEGNLVATELGLSEAVRTPFERYTESSNV